MVQLQVHMYTIQSLLLLDSVQLHFLEWQLLIRHITGTLTTSLHMQSRLRLDLYVQSSLEKCGQHWIRIKMTKKNDTKRKMIQQRQLLQKSLVQSMQQQREQ